MSRARETRGVQRARGRSIDAMLVEMRAAVIAAQWVKAADLARDIAGTGEVGRLFRTLGDHFELMAGRQYAEPAQEPDDEPDDDSGAVMVEALTDLDGEPMTCAEGHVVTEEPTDCESCERIAASLGDDDEPEDDEPDDDTPEDAGEARQMFLRWSGR